MSRLFIIFFVIIIFIGCDKRVEHPSSKIVEGWPPNKACSYLDYSLKTRGYNNKYDDEYSCSSPYKEIGSESSIGLRNNLAYYVSGKQNTASSLKLVLNYNQPNSAAFATEVLVDTSSVLANKATENKIPPSITEAIASSQSAIETINGIRHEVKRDEWPNGRGYEIHYILTKP